MICHLNFWVQAHLTYLVASILVYSPSRYLCVCLFQVWYGVYGPLWIGLEALRQVLDAKNVYKDERRNKGIYLLPCVRVSSPSIGVKSIAEG